MDSSLSKDAAAELDEPLLADADEVIAQEKQQQVVGGLRQWWARDHSDNPLMCVRAAAQRRAAAHATWPLRVAPRG